uniref:E3 ubiquitin-protein ligase RNF220 middle domain-containing protein n=1 Tax=Anopheles minimus TaxID=112268 RepID=A0A182WDF3_9DIPT
MPPDIRRHYPGDEILNWISANTFKNIRNKRQDRLRGKLRKRKFDGEDGFGLQLTNINCQSCPVCHGRLQRTQEEIAQHIEECVRKQQHQHQHQQSQQQQQQQQQQQSSQQQTSQPANQPSPQDEDETVDVESYGDETSNGAINMSSNVIHHTNATSMLHHPNSATNISNNNNNTIIKPDNPALTKLPLEESAISSLSSIVPHWDRKARLTIPLNCKPTIGDETRPWTTVVKPRMLGPFEGAGPGAVSQASNIPANDHSITRVTPTSSDQRIDVDYDQEHDHSQDMVTDNDEEVIVDNTDDEDCMKRPRPGQLTQLNGHGPPVIDSATDSMPSRTAGTTPNSDSYVSTSESAEPSSKAQVLEELKARIRELEGSPHYKCFIFCEQNIFIIFISRSSEPSKGIDSVRLAAMGHVSSTAYE